MSDDADSAGARHLVLVGMMGSGKTTVGRLVAKRLGRRFVDSDAEVEARTGRTVREIFETDGEAAYRPLETAALLDALADWAPAVIAAAGGVVLAAENREALTEADATVIWLDASNDLLVERASSGGHRPALDDDPVRMFDHMRTTRQALYEEVADHRIDVTGLAPAEVAERVLACRGGAA